MSDEMPKRDARLDDAVELPPGPPDWQQDELDFLCWEAEQREWREEQDAKVPEIVALLRRHLPAERLREIEEFLAVPYCRDQLGEALRRDHQREALRRVMPAERWPEIEDYLETGIGSGAVGAALAELD
jgi:hypothetical protein